MKREHHPVLEPIFQSSRGLHFSMYLSPEGNTQSMKAQLEQGLDQAKYFIRFARNQKEMEDFLQPVREFMNNSVMLSSVRNSLGLFRNELSFRVIQIPIPVDFLAVVASTFHVKPLLQWLQTDPGFLLLSLDEKNYRLYEGSHSDLQCIQSLRASSASSTSDPLQDVMKTLTQKMSSHGPGTSPRVYVAGNTSLCVEAIHLLPPRLSLRLNHIPVFHEDGFLRIWQHIRTALKNEAERTIQEALLEYQSAARSRLATSTMDTIVQAAVNGQIRKLIVASDMQIFGQFHPQSGDLVLNPEDMDHEDDDILDDLAQLVRAYGGDVLIAKREQLPQGRPALAILNPQPLPIPFLDASERFLV